ncbi:MAG TPA: hypothetical protein PK022_02405 [Syntrophales bacterium]|nr:hypothetical protein [Syntrophales bacterium]
MLQKICLTFLCCGLFFLLPVFSNALTPEQVIRLKKAGVDDKTIQLMISQEIAKENRDPYDTMGTKEIKDADGNAVIIYSTGKPHGGTLDRKEQEKVDQAWEMLRNMTIEIK